MYNNSTTNANGTTTTDSYSCKKSVLSYTLIGDDIKNDFKFLLPGNAMCNKLDEMIAELNKCLSIEAFDIDGLTDISQAVQEIEKDVYDLKNGLSTLYNAFIKDIDNVNAELKLNFGHWAFYWTKKEASRTQ